jgi:hypothetical protein
MGSSITKYIILIFVLGIANFGITQNVFNKAFDESNTANHTANVLDYSNKFYFTQKSFISGNAVLEALILDTMGQVLRKKHLVLDSNFNIFYGFPGSFQRLTNNEFCQQFHTALDSTINLVFFDDSLNVIRNTHYDFGNFITAGVIKQINDSTLLTLGRVKNVTKYNLFLINTDLQGNERWRTTFGETGKDNYGFSIEFASNHIIVGGQTLINGSTSHPSIFKFNQTGTLVFDTTYTQYSSGGHFFTHPSFGWYMSAAKNTSSRYYPVLLKLNTDFTVSFAKTYFSNEKYVSIGQHKINDAGIITSAGMQIVNNLITGLFFQTNHNGDSLGSKLLDHIPGERAQFHDIRPTSDGGYILAGETHTPSQDSWIVKVNEWGCDNIPCIVSVAEVPKDENGFLSCYPNPSNGLGTIKGSFKNAHSSNEIKVFNSLGQLVFSKIIVTKDFETEVNLPNSGLYLVNLYQGNTLVESLKWVVQ